MKIVVPEEWAVEERELSWREPCGVEGWEAPVALPTVEEVWGREDLGRMRMEHEWYGGEGYREKWRKGEVSDGAWKYVRGELLSAYDRRRREIDNYYRISRLKIVTKSGERKEFVPNVAQRKILEAVGKQRARGKPVRVMGVKGRQFGFSTVCTALMYDAHASHPNWQGFILSNSVSNVEWLNGIYQNFWKMDKSAGKPEAKLTQAGTKYPGAEAGGSIEIYASRYYEMVLGQTRQMGLFDEAAFWQGDFGKVMSAAMQIVPREPITMVFVITTPRGVNSDCHKLWMLEGDGFERVFVAWWEMPENRMEFYGDRAEKKKERMMNTLGEKREDLERFGKERELQARYNLSAEQLLWRRDMILNWCQGSEELFKMWYPSDVDEGWLSSSSRFFDFDLSGQWAAAKAREEHVREYDVDFKRNAAGNVTDCEMIPKRGGRIKIYRQRKKGRKYVMGVDTAGGKLVDTNRREPDRSVIQVLDRGDLRILEPMEQAAKFKGHIEPHLLGWVVYALGNCYNEAWAAIESNNHGGTTIEAAKIKYRKRIVPEPRKNKQKMDVMKVQAEQTLGIKTTITTRPLMLDTLARALQGGEVLVSSKEFLEECSTFVRGDMEGRPEAQTGCYDDEIMAMALAVSAHILGWAPGATPQEEAAANLEEDLNFRKKLRAAKPGDIVNGLYVCG